MKKNILILAILFSSSILFAQEVFTVKHLDNKVIYGKDLKLFLGDSILVEAEINNNEVTEFKRVKSITDSEKTIIITFNYDYFGSNKASLLKIKNPFSKTLAYAAKIKPENSIRFSETSIMPIYPRIYSTEMWPDKLECIILSDFKLK